MHIVVVYDSEFGNTASIAKAIARGAGTVGCVRLMTVTEASTPFAERPDLLLVGGPTQRRNMSPDLREFVDALDNASLVGVFAATFDTRYRGSAWIMGSASKSAKKRLQKAGADFVVQPESFFIGRGGPLSAGQGLEAGEVERAEAWGKGVSSLVAQT